MTDRQYFLLAVGLYALSTIYLVFLWRKGFRQDNRANYFLLLGGGVLHTIAMFKRGFDLQHCPVNNLYEAITFVTWTVVAVYLLVGLWSRLRFLGAFASPVILTMGVFALMPALDPPRGAHPEFKNGLLSLHAALGLLSYGAFALASVAGLMYVSQEHNLKFDKMRAVFSMMPSIQRLELAMSRLLLGGFLLYSCALAVGFIDFAQGSAAYKGEFVKISWSIMVWFIYLGLLFMRWKLAKGGRKFALGAIFTFVFVLLTFWGVNQFSPSHTQSLHTQ